MVRHIKFKSIWIILLLSVFCISSRSFASPEDNPGNGDDTQSGSSQVPVMYLTIDPEEFDLVNESSDHSYKAKNASIQIRVPDDYTGDYSAEELEDSPELELEYIRGRGNGTWGMDKNPYKIKLAKKADLLGMGEDKHWVLLANRNDPSLLRNRIISYIGTQLGLQYTPRCLPVDLVVNGEYYGSYLLCQQVRIGETRVNIDELTAEDVREPELTGGYLLCLNPLYDEPLENKFATDHLVRFGLEAPEFSEGEDGQPEQKAYITDYIQKTENAIFDPDFADAEGKPYSEYMDVQSAARYWWVQEYSCNYDGLRTSSTYLYKERGGRLFWGPLWDFDLSLDGGLGEIEGFLNCTMPWLDHLRAHEPDFQQTVKETWEELDQILDRILEPEGILDTYAAQIRESWDADYLRWNQGRDDPLLIYEFDDSIEALREWMLARQNWINENIDGELTHVYDRITFVADGETVRTEELLHGSTVERLPYAPDKEGYVFTGWERKDHSGLELNQTVTEDMEVYAVYGPEEEAVIARDIYFSDYDVWLNIHNYTDSCVYTLVPEDATERRVRWTSSDPDIVEVDEYGDIRMKKTGEAVITGTLRSGSSRSFEVHVYDSLVTEVVEPEQIELSADSMTLTQGEYSQIMARLSPKPNSSVLWYSSEDDSVAAVDYNGVIHAIAPGMTTVLIESSGEAAVTPVKVSITVDRAVNKETEES